MTTLTYRVEFQSPFRVATGDPGDGLDAAVDHDRPLPASTLKGLMRVAAERLIGSDHPRIIDIFGGRGDAGRWRWSHGSLEHASMGVRSRIAVDADTGTVVGESLQRAEHIEANSASFAVESDPRLSDADREIDVALLTAAAQSTISLGGDRNRGFGWVHIQAQSFDEDQAHHHLGIDNIAAQIIALRHRDPSGA